MTFGVIVFPGSNCDTDCYHCLKDVFKEDVKYIWHDETDLSGIDCVVLPGGFSYGDYLRCGAIAKFSPIINSIIDFAREGGTVIGICNGFQVLLEIGLLPGAMVRNKNLHFICKYVHLKTETKNSRFSNKAPDNKTLHIPIAHNEGSYFIDEAGLEGLIQNEQILFRYADTNNEATSDSNPNGAVYNIAGITNKEGNVMGMMPHPERCADPVLGETDGAYIFQSLIDWHKNNAKKAV